MSVFICTLSSTNGPNANGLLQTNVQPNHHCRPGRRVQGRRRRRRRRGCWAASCPSWRSWAAGGSTSGRGWPLGSGSSTRRRFLRCSSNLLSRTSEVRSETACPPQAENKIISVLVKKKISVFILIEDNRLKIPVIWEIGNWNRVETRRRRRRPTYLCSSSVQGTPLRRSEEALPELVPVGSCPPQLAVPPTSS